MTPARTVAPNHGGRANTRGRAAVATHSPIAQARSMGLCAARLGGAFFLVVSALVHGANSFAYQFPNQSERIGARRYAV